MRNFTFLNLMYHIGRSDFVKPFHTDKRAYRSRVNDVCTTVDVAISWPKLPRSTFFSVYLCGDAATKLMYEL